MCLCVLYTMCFVSNAIIRLVYDVLSSTSIYIRYMIVYTFIFNNDDARPPNCMQGMIICGVVVLQHQNKNMPIMPTSSLRCVWMV